MSALAATAPQGDGIDFVLTPSERELAAQIELALEQHRLELNARERARKAAEAAQVLDRG